MPAPNWIQGYLHLNSLKGQVCHSTLSKTDSSVIRPELIGQIGLRWTLESTVSSWKGLELHLSDKSVWMFGSRVYCSWIRDADLFSSPLCCRLRQSAAVWPGRQEPPIASKRRMSHWKHTREDFDTSTSLTPPQPLFLIAHYTYSCLRAWIPQVLSSCLDPRQFTY